MSSRTLYLNDRIYEYFCGVSLREPDLQRRLREETALMKESNMQIAPEQGQFMSLLVKLMGARRCLEVGVFTGYSSLAVSQAMSEGGILTACDVSEEYTNVAKRYWEEAGVLDRITLKLGHALETLQDLIDSGGSESYDFAFVDADKEHYPQYLELVLQLLRSGGVVLFDNVLWSGTVADDSIHDEDTDGIRSLNRNLHLDDRVEISMIPIGDGLTLAMKK